jgi:hypothetical protein
MLCINAFTEEGDPSHLYFRRLVQERVREVGLVEVNNLTETLLIKGKCMMRKL